MTIGTFGVVSGLVVGDEVRVDFSASTKAEFNAGEGDQDPLRQLDRHRHRVLLAVHGYFPSGLQPAVVVLVDRQGGVGLLAPSSTRPHRELKMDNARGNRGAVAAHALGAAQKACSGASAGRQYPQDASLKSSHPITNAGQGTNVVKKTPLDPKAPVGDPWKRPDYQKPGAF